VTSLVKRRQQASARPKNRVAAALGNGVRVLLCCAWTVCVGLPLVVVVYARYWGGLACAAFGREDLLDRAIESNAFLAGWVAQRLWANVLLAVIDVPLRVVGATSVDWSSAHVICSNHASLLDILALVRAVPPPFRFVAKRELTRWPIVGWTLRPAGQIIVDRGDRRQAIASLDDAAARKVHGQVIFFVEGTRTRSGRLQPFKKGAFHFAVRNRLPVLPVAIRGSHDALARLPWWELHSGSTIEVCFCPSIPYTTPDGGVDAEIEALRRETRAAIERELGQ
jgi:1-acyl-sn-glycerol-3-phosphate acyltransferase